ncbi:MAG: hypothetical protein ACR2RL_05025 [Gammaproteobacteria bacterium]
MRVPVRCAALRDEHEALATTLKASAPVLPFTADFKPEPGLWRRLHATAQGGQREARRVRHRAYTSLVKARVEKAHPNYSTMSVFRRAS